MTKREKLMNFYFRSTDAKKIKKPILFKTTSKIVYATPEDSFLYTQILYKGGNG